MKIRYTKQFTDEYGVTFNPGWVAEHSQSDCEKRIASGVAVAAEDGSRALRYSATQEVLVDACAVPEPHDPIFQQMEQQEEKRGEKAFKTK